MPATPWAAVTRPDDGCYVRGLYLEGARFEEWLMPVNQFGGMHTGPAELVTVLPFSSVKDYDDYVTRLQTLPGVLDQAVALMRAGMAKGLMPPKFLLPKVAKQADDIATPAPAESVFAGPLKKFPAEVPEADRARVRAACLAAIRDKVNPTRPSRSSCGPSTPRTGAPRTASGRCRSPPSGTRSRSRKRPRPP